MKLLVTGAWSYTYAQLQDLCSMGHQVIEMPDERGELPCAYEQVEAVVCNGLFLYHPIEKFTSLNYIQLTSAGYDRVPMDYVTAHGIGIHNAAGVYSIPMAEFAIASVLQFYKQTAFFAENQKQHKWVKHRGLKELCEKTVCIVGCGSVGTECAKRFRAFGCRVIGVNRSGGDFPAFDEVFPLTRLPEAVSGADVVILSVALTEETRHLFNRDIFAAMKDGCVLVNISRGGVIDTEAMLETLQTGRIYAALDVFEEEPLQEDSPLWTMNHVILTPHNSFVGDGNATRLWNVIAKNLESFQ